MRVLKEDTSSVCPVCLQVIPAKVYIKDGRVYLNKNCSQHGETECVIEDDAGIYEQLMNKDTLAQRRAFGNIMVAVTHRCNLNCNICYLPKRDISDFPLGYLEKIISEFKGRIIRISGGEPTLRDDLPEIIRYICSRNKMPVLITNGLKLADRRYVKRLKEAGLRSVTFSFNSFNDAVYRKINGRSILKIKMTALRNLRKEKMDVRFSVLIQKGINENELKRMYRYCLKNTDFISALRVRTVVSVGKHGQYERVYLSDLAKNISRILGVSTQDLIDHTLSLPKKDHLPCGITIKLISLFLKGSRAVRTRNPLLKGWRVIIKLLPKIGVKNTVVVLRRLSAGARPLLDFRIFLRVWPDKHTIDLEEMKRCPSAHLIAGTEETIPFCHGLILNENKLFL